jgi:hypothetical protein
MIVRDTLALDRAESPLIASDADFKEGDHPRANNGQFGSGGGSPAKSEPVSSVSFVHELHEVHGSPEKIAKHLESVPTEKLEKASAHLARHGDIMNDHDRNTTLAIQKEIGKRKADAAKKNSQKQPDTKPQEEALATYELGAPRFNADPERGEAKFAWPSARKLPIENAKHTREAWDLLDDTKGMSPDEKAEARRRILAAAKRFGINVSGWAGAQDRFALDRSSVRTRDANDFLHVSASNISKANICPYIGSEIPDYEKLGLDPQRVYQLLRDPDELKKAASTFNGVPILNRHIPVMAEKPPKEAIVGTTGTDAEFKAPYLQNSLTIWDAAAIAAIESEEQRELSCGYRYEADMSPGSFNGTPYDGVMRNLRANHVALVPDGRAGSDVVVGDQAIPQIIKDSNMTKATLSRKAVHAKGALAVYLAPKMAQDAKLDFNAILKDITAKNFTAQKPFILQRVKAATSGKLAQDASIDDLTGLLDRLDQPDAATADDEMADPNAMVEDEGPDVEAIKTAFKDKMKPEDHAKLCEMLGGTMAGDEEDEAAKKAAAEKAAKEAAAKKVDDKPIDKQAMDAAIATSVTAAVTAATDATIKRLNAVREAEQIVRPHIGELAIAQDSADAVYRLALDAAKVDHKDIKETAALKVLVQMLPKPGAAKSLTPRMAHDAAAGADYAKRFPDANRLAR